ncbi:ATP-binding protein [Luteococcus sp. Sow4_B9]|uniref:sensor histidine kinase n=1 Tax=Luteococcus sp. Sow4_B9 TaxID=3438792 RepID=UPI003F996C80
MPYAKEAGPAKEPRGNRPGSGVSMTRRLVVAQSAVILSMTATMLLVAMLVGPPVFDHHMHEAGHGNQPGVLEHATEAFRSAGSTSLLAGLGIATLVACLVSWFMVRRITAGLSALAGGARRVAQGVYDVPVQVPPSGPEIESVALAFNEMSSTIAHTEQTRRRLLTDLSHELRTPIAAIEVTLESVEDGVAELDATTIATLRQQAERLTRLARDISAVSAAEEGRLELDRAPVSLDALVRAAASSAKAACDVHDIALIVEAQTGCTVLVDGSRIGQVLDNLLTNAVRHSPPGSTIRLTARRLPDELVVEVCDEGTGISPEHLPHLFERFYRGDPGASSDDRAGTGVGLAISRAIARAHGGHLDADSEGPGRGASFCLHLPPRILC